MLAVNPKSVKKYINEELAHGRPIQLILKPPVPPKRDKDGRIERDDDGEPIPDPSWVQPDLPDWNMVVQWLKDDEVFRSDYEHSMKFGAVYLADEMLILKDSLLKDPRNASAYKTAMEMIKVSAMWRDPKYSERTIQEIKNEVPSDPEVVRARVKQLREELGLDEPLTIDVQMTEVVKPSKASPRMLAHLEKAREIRAAKKRARDASEGND